MNPERFQYSCDWVTTDRYTSAITDLEKVAYSKLSQPYSIVDLDLTTSMRIPSLRTLILTAGGFCPDTDGNGWYDLRKNDGYKEILLEAIDHNPFKKEDFPMLRLFIDYNPNEKKEQKKRTIDIWIPDSTDTQFISRINAIESVQGKKDTYNPLHDIKDINRHDRVRKFLDLWREGLRNLLNIIPGPISEFLYSLEDSI